MSLPLVCLPPVKRHEIVFLKPTARFALSRHSPDRALRFPYVLDALIRDGTKAAERAQNADFRRKPQIFADSAIPWKIKHFGGRRFSQKTADFRRKPQIFTENCRKPQTALRHLRSVTFSLSLNIFARACSLVRFPPPIYHGPTC